MTTLEILSAFMKGNEVASISEKQKSWLLSQAKRDGLKTHWDGFHDFIYLNDCHYKIESAKTHVAGYGGTRGTKFIQGRYNLRKYYTIKFDSTGLTAVYAKSDLDYFLRDTPHTFQIINQLTA